MESLFRSKAVWMPLLVFLVPLVVYLPSVARDGFVSIDDSLLITKNAAVQELSPRTIAHVFTSYDPELYIPLTLFVYQIEFALVGAQPFLFHLTSLLLHCGSAVLVLLILRRMLRDDSVAAFGAFLFALHPLNTEAVAWASALKDIQSSFFFFGAVLLYLRWRDEDRPGWPWGSIVLFLLALLSKVTVALLPLVLLLLDWREGRVILSPSLRQSSGQAPDTRRSWFDALNMTWPYFLLSALFIIIALFGKAKGIGELGLWRTGLLAGKAVMFYLLKFFAPVHLSVIYAQQTPVTLSSPEFFVPLAGAVVLLAVMVLLRNRWRDASFGIALFLLMLLPNFANFWKNRFIFFASDRYMYIPSVGLIVIVCSLLLVGLRYRRQLRPPLMGLAAAVILAFGILTGLQTRVWATDISLYANTLRWYPDSALALNNIGDAYYREGKYDDALTWFMKAAEQNPSYIQAMDNVAGVYLKRGQYEPAVDWFTRSVAAIPADPRPEDLSPRYRLGELLVDMGRTEEGLAQFAAAIKALPDLAEPYYNLGLQLQKTGRGDDAVAVFETAIALDASHVPSRYHLAGLYAERGKLAEAEEQLTKVVELAPKYEKAMEHLAAIRALKGGAR